MSLYSEYLKRCPELLECLENARNAGRLTHSFLIHAPDDRTRAEFAIVLEQLAGCRTPVNGRPDTTCPFCRQIESGTYADLHKISPVGKMYQIRVGDRTNPEPNTLRDMLDHLGYTAGKYNAAAGIGLQSVFGSQMHCLCYATQGISCRFRRNSVLFMELLNLILNAG